MTTTFLVDYTIARVNHYRCDQPAGKWGLYTYVWVPKTMTEEKFEALCDKAQKAYFKAEAEMKKLLPALPPGYGPQYDKYPDKTVAEVKAIHAEAEAEWKKRNEVVKTAQRSFTQILKDISDGEVKGFWDIEFPISVDLHWGHRHGECIDYGETRVKDPRPDNFDEAELDRDDDI
jgi:hypothetical protein